MAVYITAAGAYLPGEPVANDEIDSRLGSLGEGSERIRRRMLEANGIRTRHYALAEGGHLTMLNEEIAANAVAAALKERGTTIDEVGMMAVATTQPDLPVPGFRVDGPWPPRRRTDGTPLGWRGLLLGNCGARERSRWPCGRASIDWEWPSLPNWFHAPLLPSVFRARRRRRAGSPSMPSSFGGCCPTAAAPSSSKIDPGQKGSPSASIGRTSDPTPIATRCACMPASPRRPGSPREPPGRTRRRLRRPMRPECSTCARTSRSSTTSLPWGSRNTSPWSGQASSIPTGSIIFSATTAPSTSTATSSS